MNWLSSTRLKPAELEERFRMETLARDKTQTMGIFVLTVVIITAYLALDLRLLPKDIALRISTASRCVTVIVLLSAIWMIRRLSSRRSFDRIVFVSMMVHIGHLLIVNAFRPTDYIAVIVWDAVTIYGIYLVVPVPLRLQMLPTLLLTAGGGVVWLIYRLPLASTYETVAVLGAYLFPNLYGLFASWRLNQSRRQQFVLLLQEREARKELADLSVELEEAVEALRELNTTLETRVEERTSELQAQCARLDAILTSTTDGIVVADREGYIVRSNPVAQTWLNQTLLLEEAERLREAIRDLARQTAAEATIEETPETVLELTGIDLELSAALVAEDGTGEPSVVVDIHDVSHLKALDRMKTRFIDNMSHELRTPLTTVKLYMHLMERRPERRDEHLAILTGEMERLAALIEGILEISRIDTGRLELDPRPASPDKLTGIVSANYQELAQNQGLVLEHQPANLESMAPVDRKWMMRVLNNLVENAIRFTPEGGTVAVSTGLEQMEGRRWATMTVRDTGMGIPEGELPYVFDRFFRGEEPRAMQMTGTGLGLSIAQEIVALHGGRVTVESEEGVGSTFTVWLPFAVD